jgi:hypothetical protein
MKIPSLLLPLAAVIGIVLLAGCGKPPAPPPDTSEAHMHHHHAPHGGTVVALGEEEYHVELVLDDASGKLQAYVLDSELENFVRSSSPSLEITASVGGQARSLVLAAVPNQETGETVGDTSLFEGQSDWLRAKPAFDAVLKSLSVRGGSYSDVRFNFPNGNENPR